MKNRLFRWFRPALTASLLTVLCILTGCQSVRERISERLEVVDPEVREVLSDNIDALGGVDSWVRTGQFQASALATLPDPARGRVLLEQHYKLSGQADPSLVVTSVLPDRPYVSTLYANGTVSIDGNPNAATITDAEMTLRLIMQAVTGPVGLLLRDDMQLNYLGSQREAGRVVHKIEAVGPWVVNSANTQIPDRMVLWVDSQSDRIARIWLCPRGQDGCLAIGVRDYQRLDSGWSVPTILEVVRSDRAQDFSQEPIMIIEFRELDVTLAK